MEHAQSDDRSIKELVQALSHDSVTLVRQESELFKKEMAQRVSKVERDVALFGSGGVVAYTGALTLTAAFVLALSNVMPAWLAAFLVGAVLLAAGVLVLFTGKKKLANETMVPRETAQSVKRDFRAMREAVR
jgi:hypothetical protein